MHELTQDLNLGWITHSAFILKTPRGTIYFDPYNLTGKEPPADYIIITHDHQDHLSIEDLQKITTPNTTIITIPESQSKLSPLAFKQLVIIEPNKSYNLKHFKIQTIPAYNTNKYRAPKLPHHPKEDEHVGFIIDINGYRIYNAGDTDYTEEIKQITNINCALMPVSGGTVMTAQEAAEATNHIKPQLAIPTHWGNNTGSIIDAERYKTLVKTQVLILKREIF